MSAPLKVLRRIGVLCGLVFLFGGIALIVDGAFAIHSGLGWMLSGSFVCAVSCAVIAWCAE